MLPVIIPRAKLRRYSERRAVHIELDCSVLFFVALLGAYGGTGIAEGPQ